MARDSVGQLAVSLNNTKLHVAISKQTLTVARDSVGQLAAVSLTRGQASWPVRGVSAARTTRSTPLDLHIDHSLLIVVT